MYSRVNQTTKVVSAIWKKSLSSCWLSSSVCCEINQNQYLQRGCITWKGGMVERMRRAIEVTRKRLLTIINTWWQLVLKDSDNILICVLHGAFLIHVLLNESCTRFNEK